MSMSESHEQEKTHMPQTHSSSCKQFEEEHKKQKQPRHQNTSLRMASFPVPDDISLRIASFLEVRDLCSLACCSKFWREFCGTDCLWASLALKRWPSLEFLDDPQSSSSSTAIERPTDKGWRLFYIEMHNRKIASVAAVVEYVEECLVLYGSLEVAQYHRAIAQLHEMKIGFVDVEMLLLKRTLSVQLNLLGLHSCMNWLRVPVTCIVKALQKAKITERRVCVKWLTLGKWSKGYRIRMNDELHTRQFNLLDAVLARQEEVLAVLYRGAVHEVLRVQITVAKPSSTPWCCQSLF